MLSTTHEDSGTPGSVVQPDERVIETRRLRKQEELGRVGDNLKSELIHAANAVLAEERGAPSNPGTPGPAEKRFLGMLLSALGYESTANPEEVLAALKTVRGLKELPEQNPSLAAIAAEGVLKNLDLLREAVMDEAKERERGQSR